MKEEPSCLYTFGPFRLDPAKRILWRGSEPIPLTGRAFDTLLVLIQNPGETIEKDQIIKTVWRGTAVEENNLTQCISALRKALGESRGDNRFIVTLAGQGYRFVADVETMAVAPAAPIQNPAPQIQNGLTAVRGTGGEGIVAPASAGAQPAAPGLPIPDSASKVQIRISAVPQPTASPIQNPRSKIQHRIGLAASGLFGLAVVLAAIFWYAEGKSRLPLSRASPSSGASIPAVRRRMLAVLPFENLTGDPKQDYFSDGFTEEVITRLGRLDPDHLGVIARTSVMRYRNTEEDVRAIAGELGVSYVLEGSVRQSGKEVRISVQLVRASDQTPVWAQSYERPLRNAFALQENVAKGVQLAIVRRLGLIPTSPVPKTLPRRPAGKRSSAIPPLDRATRQ